jgi:uncharacterized protein (TIGR03437 family)
MLIMPRRDIGAVSFLPAQVRHAKGNFRRDDFARAQPAGQDDTNAGSRRLRAREGLRLFTLFFLFTLVVPAQTVLRYFNDLGFLPSYMTTDANGNVFVAGSIQMPSPPGILTPPVKVIIVKLDRSNNVLYRFVFGGSVSDFAAALTLDSSGNVWVVGTTSSPDFPLVNPVISQIPLNQYTGFISKIDPTGTRLLFSTYLGGSSAINNASTGISAVALDPAGNVYVTGNTTSIDFPVTPNAYQRTVSGPAFGFAFVAKLTNSGDRLVYSTYIGNAHTNCSGGSACIDAAAYTEGSAIAISSDGSATVAGTTSADPLPVTAGAFQTQCKCSYHNLTGFVVRLSADGASLVWSTYLGGTEGSFGSSGDRAQSVALTSDGGVVVAGYASTGDFPVTPGAFQTSLRSGAGGANIFVSRLSANGSTLEYSTLLGGSVSDDFFGMQLDAQEDVWLTGSTSSPDFPTVPGGLALGTAFVVELASDGTKLLKTQMVPNGAAGQALAIDAAGNETLLGLSGSLLRIPAGGPTGISILGQVNAAAYAVSGMVAPGEIVSLYGTGLGPSVGAIAKLDSTGKVPTTLADVRMLFDGIPAPLLYAGANQINAIVPFEIGGKTSTTVQVVSGSATSPPVKLMVVPSYPEIFFLPPSPTFPAAAGYAYAAAINGDGTINSPSHPAKPGSIVVFWANGAGLFTGTMADGSVVKPPLFKTVLPVSVLFDNNQPLEVLYAGASPALVAGVTAVIVRLPGSFPRTEHTLRVQVGDAMSDVVNIITEP